MLRILNRWRHSKTRWKRATCWFYVHSPMTNMDCWLFACHQYFPLGQLQ